VSVPTYSELATALAFILQKWKETGADPVETKAFDDLLARVKDEPPTGLPSKTVQNVYLDDEPKRRSTTSDPRFAELDAEIDRLNREID
jgi:hypothetical protein